MKKSAFSLLFCLNLASGAELAIGRTVFLLPMSHGLDQFVANRLTRMHVLQVVTDPAKADIIITDQVGQSFETRLNELFPPPEPKEAPKEKPKEKVTEKGDLPAGAGPGLASMLGAASNKPEAQGALSSYGRGRGTIFLVDIKSRQVLWSAFQRPNGYTPHQLDQTAEHIVKRLKEDLTPKAK